MRIGEKVIEVRSLEESQRLTTAGVEKYLTLNFNGVSGRGTSQMDNIFNEPLDCLAIEIENGGKLKNGDQVKTSISKYFEESLFNVGDILEKEEVYEVI